MHNEKGSKMTGEGSDMPKPYYRGNTESLRPADTVFSEVGNPEQLYSILSDLWCAETCAPRMRADWTPENKTLGQCSVTAFLIQDIYGGRVYGIPLEDGNVHCYNVVGNCTFDLTCEQFGDRILYYGDDPLQTREKHFAKAEKYARYLMLRERLLKYLAGNGNVPDKKGEGDKNG